MMWTGANLTNWPPGTCTLPEPAMERTPRRLCNRRRSPHTGQVTNWW